MTKSELEAVEGATPLGEESHLYSPLENGSEQLSGLMAIDLSTSKNTRDFPIESDEEPEGNNLEE